MVNVSPSERDSLVELEVDAPEDWQAVELELPDGRRVATQRVAWERRLMPPFPLVGRDIRDLFARRLHGRELFGRSLDGFQVEHDADRPRLTLLLDEPLAPDELDMGALLDAIAAEAARAPESPWQIVPAAAPRRRVAAVVPAPALGWTVVRAVEARAAEGASSASATSAHVRVDERSMDNALVTVSVADDGTLALQGGGSSLSGVGRIEDGGDFGDSYNHAPPHRDRVVDQPAEVRVRVLEHGPLRGRLEVLRRYAWPRGILPDGSARNDEEVPVDVLTTVELHAGEPFVRLRVAFENRSRDHRVRFLVPLPTATDHTAAEAQFAVVERGLTMEGGHGEKPLPTHPARGFVHAAGASVLLDHVVEYELVDGSALALTLLRSIGLISRNDNPWREDPAGPEVAVPGAQMLGDWSIAFAIMPHAAPWSEAGVLAAAERYAHAPLNVRGLADAAVAATAKAGISLKGDGVVLSSLRRRDDWLELRLIAEHPLATRARLAGRLSEAREVDLLGRPGEPVAVGADGSITIELGAWEIRSLQVR